MYFSDEKSITDMTKNNNDALYLAWCLFRIMEIVGNGDIVGSGDINFVTPLS